MTFTSFAQNFEDVLLWRALRDVKVGTYVDIGAQDPVFDSVSRGFYEKGWRGILVEPTRQYAELLKVDRPDETVVQAVVSKRRGTMRFFTIPDTGLSTCEPAVVEGHRQNGWTATEMAVEAVTLDDIFAMVDGDEVHWLKIDVEGHERDVLRGWRKSRLRPWIIVVEAIRPGTRIESHKSWEDRLSDKGYKFAHFDGINRYYVSRQHADLKRHFRYGASLWDEIQIPASSRLAATLQRRHQDSLAELRTKTVLELTEQAKAVERAQSSVAELTASLSVAKGELSKSRLAWEQANAMLGQKHGELLSSYDEVERTAGALDQSNQQARQSQTELAAVREALATAEAGVTYWKSAEAEAQAALVHANEQFQQAVDDLQTTRSAQNQTKAELDQAYGDLREVREALGLTRIEVGQTREALTSIATSWQRTKMELDTARGRAEVVRAGLDKSRADLGLSESMRLQLSEEIRAARSELLDLQSRLASMSAEKAAVDLKFGRTQSELHAAYGKLVDRDHGQREAARELEQLRSALDSVRNDSARDVPAEADAPAMDPRPQTDDPPPAKDAPPGDTLHRLGALEERVRRFEGTLPGSSAREPAKASRSSGNATPVWSTSPLPGKAPSVPSLTWRFAAGATDTEPLASALAEALHRLGHAVVADETKTDMVLGFDVAPPVRSGDGASTLLVDVGGLASVEAGPGIAGIVCSTRVSAKALVDRGMAIPVAAIGLGVDHLVEVQRDGNYAAPGKAFRFLHVSACDPGSGIDLLVDSFTHVFSAEDDVSLVIRPIAGRAEDLIRDIERRRAANRDLPDIVVVEGPLTAAELAALYEQCHVFAATSRCQGFGLPVAEALLRGLPVAVTACGGHRDYCDATNSWLIDYRLEHGAITDDRNGAVCAVPAAGAIDGALIAAHQAGARVRGEMAAMGRRRMLDHYSWSAVARRLAAFAHGVREAGKTPPKAPRLGWVTTWNVRCGIASYSSHLLAAIPTADVVIFAARQEPKLQPDQANCLRCWESGKQANGLDEIARNLEKHAVDALVIQFNYGFFCHAELSALVDAAADRDIAVIMDLHSTADPAGDMENFRLAELVQALRRCHRVLAHSPADMERLKDLGIVDNVMLFPHGVHLGDGDDRPWRLGLDTLPVLACFGFCLPHKGLQQLVEAVALLRQSGQMVRLRMHNAEHPAPESAAEIRQIRALIEQLDLQQQVELCTDFLDDETSLKRLGEADLVVNPYQRTGESASGAVRYGLASGRPVAVTPCPIFHDLGNAVIRLPGVAPRSIAAGIAHTLSLLRSGAQEMAQVKMAARRWCMKHDYGRQASRLLRIVAASRGLPEPTLPVDAGSGAHMRRPRGVFINTAAESCSIHESGRMVHGCIMKAGSYSLDYVSLDMIDVRALTSEGKIRRLDDADGQETASGYDFWVFNWHFITMAQVPLERIAALPGRKFAIILEADPGNPLRHVPEDVFDGYLVLDPTAEPTAKIFPFPRPLEGVPRQAGPAGTVPVIGSFGFGTPGKGFELLVEAVNREFDQATIRVNIPRGAYTAAMDGIHQEDYAKYIEALCQRIAKPGIEVLFTQAFMSPEDLVGWCGENDLNCFLYSRRQAGLSATTDQAILSGRPLLIGSNDTFRHIHRYIAPYPVTGLRQAMEAAVPAVERMQRDWSREAFLASFENMLAAQGLIAGRAVGGTARGEPAASCRPTIAVLTAAAAARDIRDYARRAVDSLSRTGKFDIALCSDVAELDRRISANATAAVLLVECGTALRQAADVVLKRAGDVRVVDLAARQPIVPYYTPAVLPRKDPPRIMLVGFGDHSSNLHEVVGRIEREAPEAEIWIEAPPASLSDVRSRVTPLSNGKNPIHVFAMPAKADDIIEMTISNRLTIFFNDPSRTDELEDIASLAMTTERAVAFTRAAPFPNFDAGATFVDDLMVEEIMEMGMQAHIRLCWEFGEGQFYARIVRAIDSSQSWES